MIRVEKFLPPEWAQLAEKAHLVVFDKNRPAKDDRIDYALIASEDGMPYGYITCKEHDSDTIYWQFGGAFPSSSRSSNAVRGYQAMIGWTKERYKRVFTIIENSNTTMLKLAMAHGFRICGVRVFQNQVLVEHILDFGKE